MQHERKLTSRQRPRPEQLSAGNEPARFLRNLTSLPDADFASTYAPAIAAVLATYADLPDPAAARRALLLALKAALKRRRAFILPRFTQAEDSWRIRECASYAVAIAVLVEHACTLLDRTERSADHDAWVRILGDPEADPDGCATRIAFLHAIVPAQGRRWIAREPLVQTLIANYFTATPPDELGDIIGPVVAGFGHDRQAARLPAVHDLPSPLEPGPNDPSKLSPQHRQRLLIRAIERVRAILGRRPARHGEPGRIGAEATNVTEAVPADHRPKRDDAPSPIATPEAPRPQKPRLPEPKPPPGIPATSRPHSASSGTHAPRPPTSKPPRHRRSRPRVADILDGIPAAPTPANASIPSSLDRRRDIGDHGAATARISHAAGYASRLAAENGTRHTHRKVPFLLPGPVPDPSAQPLDIHALFPAAADVASVDSDGIAPWIDFRDHLVEALRTGAQSANEDRSLVHLLDVGAYLVWPQVALHFADHRRIDPAAIKSAMRAARVLAVNRADRQDDRHAFPARTGDPNVTCHGLVTLPEYLWPDASLRPTEPSRFVRPPAIYGQRYRRPR